jgi:AraC-like DNA-binding protein
MINVYDFLVSQDDAFKKLSVGDSMFIHYQCPQIELYATTYVHLNAVVYVISGAKKFHHNGQSYTLSEGNCYFIQKGAAVQERMYDKDWILIAFFMPDHYLHQLINEFRNSGIKTVPKFSTRKVIELHMENIVIGFFQSMLPYFIQKPQPPENLIELKYRELLYSLLSDAANKPFLAHLGHLGNNRLQPLEEVMEQNFRYNLSLADFARISQRSLSTFTREFIGQFKITPGKWLTEKRLHHAKWLLDTTLKNINEIADESGFENSSHFSKAYKDQFGMSPTHYRNAPASVNE